MKKSKNWGRAYNMPSRNTVTNKAFRDAVAKKRELKNLENDTTTN